MPYRPDYTLLTINNIPFCCKSGENSLLDWLIFYNFVGLLCCQALNENKNIRKYGTRNS